MFSNIYKGRVRLKNVAPYSVGFSVISILRCDGELST